MSLNTALKLNNLFDLYGELLTSRQKEVFKYYYHEDFSYQEIADMLNISKSAVYDSISKTSILLNDFEEKVGLLILIERLKAMNNPEVDLIINKVY